MAKNKHTTEIAKIRRRVLTEVARLALNGNLEQEIDELPEKLVSLGDHRYRCCEYKEKAIYAERIKLALGLSQKEEYKKKRLSEILPQALEYPDMGENQVNVIEIACEGCPINKFFVTNACQNCLAHSCQNSCPKDAISVVQNQAYIDQTRCLECGLCKKSCPYGAIIEINRPCEASCHIGAVEANTDRKATIDEQKCVECGACVVGCPYGAISDRSQIVRVIELLKKEKVYGVIAPSFVGQLGQKEDHAPLFKAIKNLGFVEVVEAALGADLVSLEEAEEFMEKVPQNLSFMTSSCCPGFVKLIKNHHPELEQNMSATVSPMVATAKYIKKQDPEAKVVFIGPCVAKKSEAWESEAVEAVITFEELTAILVAAQINVSEIVSEESLSEDVSGLARGFANAGGVKTAVDSIIASKECTWDPINAQGLKECNEVLKDLASGKIKKDFLEGMACTGGCMGGPGTIIDGKMTKRYLQKVCQNSQRQAPFEVEAAQSILKELEAEMHRKK